MALPETGPQKGDKILLMAEPWLSLVLSGKKTMEVRGTAFRAGKYYLGIKEKIYGVALTGPPRFIADSERFRQLRPLHRVTGTKPYKNTFGLPIVKVKCFPKPIPYKHTRGAQQILKYRC